MLIHETVAKLMDNMKLNPLIFIEAREYEDHLIAV